MKDILDKNIRFLNFKYDKNKYYFILISELRAYGLGHFFKEAINKALLIPLYKIEFITIAPDVFEQYNYNNLIIVNSVKTNTNTRKTQDDFINDISNNKYINHLINNLILKNQDKLYLYMFESNKYLTLHKQENVILIGPDSNIVKQLSNKVSLYEIFHHIVPMADYIVVYGYKELLDKSKNLLKKYHKIFISLQNSAAGINSIICDDIKTIKARFEQNKEDIFLLTNYIEHISDPTSLGVVINENEVYIAGLADQNINGTSFVGSIFPSKLDKTIQNNIINLSRKIGKKMATLGYRGIFGCDFIVTKDKKIFFIETNPRKQGTTMEFCCTLKTNLPKNAPNLPEIEFYAINQNKKAPNIKEPYFFNTNIFWGTYNEKMKNKIQTYSYLPQQRSEIDMFLSVAHNKLKKEYMILEHVGENLILNKGSFLGRVIATGKSYKDVEDGINMGRKMLQFTIQDIN